MTGRFVIQLLRSEHDRSTFACGTEALDRYFRQQVTQDMRRRVASCYVAVEVDGGRVAGYYTIAASGVPLTELPEETARKLPRYPVVPVARLGRLAVDLVCQGQQLGAALLWDAAARAARSELMAFALVVDAKDETAASFYRWHGLMAFGSLDRQFMFPLAGLKS